MGFIKKTASFVASFIIILALGGFVFVRNFDLNRYKGEIEGIVLRETGRQLKLNGDAKLGISLIPTVVVNDVTFSNPEWANNPYMAKLERLEVKFAILPLLKKQIIVDKLILQKPEIYLETAKDGANSWVFNTGMASVKDAVQQGQPQIKDASAAAAVALIAREVVLENGIISYYGAKQNSTQQIILNSLELDVDGNDAPVNLDIDAVYDGQPVTAQVTANTLNSILNDGKVDFDAQIKALKVSAVLSGSAEDITDSPRYAAEGNIHNPAGNFGAPETSLEMRVDGDVSSADVAIKNLSIATNKITGKVSVDWSKAKPYIKADLSTAAFDLNSLSRNSAVAFALPSFIGEAQALAMVPNDKVPYEYLNTANANINVSVGKIIVSDDLTLSSVAASAKLQNGVLDVTKFNAGVGGGQIQAKGQVNAAKQSVVFKLDSQNLKLQDLQKSLSENKGGNMQVLSGGNLDVMADLTSAGATYRKLSENLNGQFIAIMDKSEIKTGKLKWFTNNIFSQILSVLGIDTSKNADMSVACAVVRSDIKDGKATFPSGIVFDGSKLKVVSSGTVNLTNDKIDFTIAPAMNKLADGNITQALASFIKLQGTLQNPKIGLDKTSALTTVVGTMMTGGVYLGSEVLLDGASSPCYTALAGTKYASRFPKPTGVKAATKGAYQDVGKQTKAVVKGFEGATKNLIGAFKDTLKKGK